MNSHYLTSLFTPGSIALFGASDREDSVGGIVFKNLLDSDFKGRIYAINPARDVVQEQPAYKSLDEIDGPTVSASPGPSGALANCASTEAGPFAGTPTVASPHVSEPISIFAISGVFSILKRSTS